MILDHNKDILLFMIRQLKLVYQSLILYLQLNYHYFISSSTRYNIIKFRFIKKIIYIIKLSLI